MAVDIEQISSVYENLEEKVKKTLDEQWNSGRLTGSDYAQVLSSAINTILQITVKTVQEQPLTEEQKALYARQTQGFDDNLKQKMLEIQLNAWGLMFSSGMLEQSPGLITNDEATTLYNNLKTQLGL